jgi:hypothetical protein
VGRPSAFIRAHILIAPLRSRLLSELCWQMEACRQRRLGGGFQFLQGTRTLNPTI